MSLFNRLVKFGVELESGELLVIDGLATNFVVKKYKDKKKNTCSVSVYNLGYDTIKKIVSEKGVGILEAGYDEDKGLVQLFYGETVKVENDHARPDSLTTFELKSGRGKGVDKVVSLSYTDNTPLSVILKDIATKTGLSIKTIEQTTAKYFSGYAFHGPILDALTEVSSKAGFEWSIIDNELVIANPDSTNLDTIEEITYKTGLMSMRPINKDGTSNLFELRMLLKPQIQPGDILSIDNEMLQGQIVVDSLTHKGSNVGPDFTTTVIGGLQ